MVIRREKEITYVNVGIPLLDELEPIFRKQRFEYEILYGENIPKDVPRHIMLGDRRAAKCVCCIKSHMNAEDVRKTMLQVWFPARYGNADESE